jgi:hypothetical protein
MGECVKEIKMRKRDKEDAMSKIHPWLHQFGKVIKIDDTPSLNTEGFWSKNEKNEFEKNIKENKEDK